MHAVEPRQIPRVDALMAQAELRGLPRSVCREGAREVLADARASVLAGETVDLDLLPTRVAAWVASRVGVTLRPVINATGIVVHTNLGRAPWAPEALAAATEVARGYCDLELDLETGRRGGRLAAVERQLRLLTGAEDAYVVNNCAAAVLLAVTALAQGREVLISRGELVEIGGSFRVPEVLAAGGALRVEVGTTNRTRIADFERALTDRSAALLRVHPSNFRITGFVEQATREELVSLGRERGVPVIEDVGSGSLDGGRGEPGVREAVQAGVDVVLFSGDKLLGGPQAGLCVGTKTAIERLRSHPMARALRVDKVTLAALEATLALHLRGEPAPVQAMLGRSERELEEAAHRLSAMLNARGVDARVEVTEGYVGGGAVPDLALRSRAVVVPAAGREAVAHRLRVGRPAVLGRLRGGALWLDVRAVPEPLFADLADRVEDALRDG